MLAGLSPREKIDLTSGRKTADAAEGYPAAATKCVEFATLGFFRMQKYPNAQECSTCCRIRLASRGSDMG
jgi:hypothetical protein